MKKVILFFWLISFAWACHTPLSCVDKHPQNYIGRTITVTGMVQDWLQDYHGFYFIVLTNRYHTHSLVVYKQMPNLWYHQRIKVTGILIQTKTRNNHRAFVLVDTNRYDYSVDSPEGPVTGFLRFRDSLPMPLWYNDR